MFFQGQLATQPEYAGLTMFRIADASIIQPPFIILVSLWIKDNLPKNNLNFVFNKHFSMIKLVEKVIFYIVDLVLNVTRPYFFRKHIKHFPRGIIKIWTPASCGHLQMVVQTIQISGLQC